MGAGGDTAVGNTSVIKMRFLSEHCSDWKLGWIRQVRESWPAPRWLRPFIATRELVLRRSWRCEDDGTILILYSSTTHHKCRPRPREWWHWLAPIRASVSRSVPCRALQTVSLTAAASWTHLLQLAARISATLKFAPGQCAHLSYLVCDMLFLLMCQVEAGYTFSPLMPRFTSSGASGECLVTQVRMCRFWSCSCCGILAIANMYSCLCEAAQKRSTCCGCERGDISVVSKSTLVMASAGGEGRSVGMAGQPRSPRALLPVAAHICHQRLLPVARRARCRRAAGAGEIVNTHLNVLDSTVRHAALPWESHRLHVHCSACTAPLHRSVRNNCQLRP